MNRNRNRLLEKLKKLSKENMELKKVINNNNPIRCCKCIEVDVWKQKAYTLTEIVFEQKNLIDRLEKDLMYLTP